MSVQNIDTFEDIKDDTQNQLSWTLLEIFSNIVTVPYSVIDLNLNKREKNG